MKSTQNAIAAPNTPAARRAMIDSQLRPSGVSDAAVLAAMAGCPREDFVPPAYRDAAYMDRAVPLGDGRFLAAPLVHARMLAEAAPTLADHALLVSGGCAYLETLLRPMVATLDVVAAGAEPAAAPAAYTLIVIDGAIEAIPDALGRLLADGGRLVTGLVDRGVTRLAIGRKAAGSIGLLRLAEIGMPVLAAFDRPARWTF